MSVTELKERARQLDQAGEQINELGQQLRNALPLLQLAAYASEAMRVLAKVEGHARQTPDFERLMRFICHDWHNPGAVHDPSDLIADVLARLAADLQILVKRMEEIMSGIAGTETEVLP